MNKLYYLIALLLSVMFVSSFVVDLRQTLQAKPKDTTATTVYVPKIEAVPVQIANHTANNPITIKSPTNVTIQTTAPTNNQTVNQASVPSTKNQTVVQSFESNETTEPLILNVSTNIWKYREPRDTPNHEVYVTVVTEYADTCVLSYMVLSCYPPVMDWSGPFDTWINVTMTQNGNIYNGTIPGGLPTLADVHWKVTAEDAYGRSVETETSWFNVWDDP